MIFQPGMHPDLLEISGRDAFQRGDASLWNKRASQGCIRTEKIIPAEQKSMPRMHPGGKNNPCGTKERVRDASGRKK